MTMRDHVARCERARSGWRACCSCGWTGAERWLHQVAREDAREHERERPRGKRESARAEREHDDGEIG